MSAIREDVVQETEELSSSERQESKTVSGSTICRVNRTVETEDEFEFTNDQEIIEVNKFITTPAIATVEIPVKVSKNYNSMGITVGVSLPCYSEELEAGIERARKLAMQKVRDEIPSLKASLDKFMS